MHTYYKFTHKFLMMLFYGQSGVVCPLAYTASFNAMQVTLIYKTIPAKITTIPIVLQLTTQWRCRTLPCSSIRDNAAVLDPDCMWRSPSMISLSRLA